VSTTLPGVARDRVGAGTLPTPPRDRRRPALAALAVLLIVAGALGSALAAYRSGDQVQVLVAARDIPIGTKITDADLASAQVAADGAESVASSARSNFVGTYATTTVPEGTLVNRTMFRVGSPTPSDAIVVGVVVTSAQRPAAPIVTGDVVRAYLVPKGSDGSIVGSAGDVLVPAARVVDVRGGSSADSLAVSLLVPSRLARDIVPAASGGQVSLTLLAPSTRPLVDVTGG
jgi:SAF domain-containing protein